MSTSTIASYVYVGTQVIIYGGIPILIIGVLGGILSTTVFLSLETFRRNSCAFYLTIMSVVNIGQLLTGLLSRILMTVYKGDGSEGSLFYCKFRPYFLQICTSMSWTCFCLATIDQYCATSSCHRLQRWCSIKLARRLIIVFVTIWILHTVPYLILYDYVVSPSTGKLTCIMTNSNYIRYRAYIMGLLLSGFLPVFVTILFGSMAYYNVHRSPYYTLPLVRRELDKQLTTMVLVEVVFNSVTVLPFTITNVWQSNTNLNSDPIFKAQIQLAYDITTIISYLYFASPFYIYICVSERFRRQLVYVLFKKLHLHRHQPQPRMIINQVSPQS